MSTTVLIVDDDPTQRRIMRAVVEKAGYAAAEADSGDAALSALRADANRDIALMMLDLVMPEMDGFEVLKRLKDVREELPVIVLTAQGGIDTVVSAMQAGACDFFVKPASPERVAVSIKNALNLNNLKGEVSRLKRKQTNALGFTDMIGQGPAMAQVARMGERAAQSNIPVLILGESGVGKELVARAIQGSSDRAGRPFVVVNCGAIPENLVESILFGHEKGSFTGATAKHVGKFQEADGGTIFLDEIGELPLDMQVKLLRTLQEGEVDPVGAKRPVKVDVRVISATNRDLLEEVRGGTFREDLYYRLNVFPVQLPPLRERKEDVPALIDHFIQRYNAEEGRSVRGVKPDVMDILLQQPWPGNVRQLENTIFRAVVLCERSYLSADDFPHLAAEFEAAGVALGEPEHVESDTPPPYAATRDEDDAEGFRKPYPQPPTPAPIPQPQDDAPGEGEPESALHVFDRSGHLRRLHDIERDLIQLAIETYDGQMSEVARRLGIGRSTLYRKVREQGLEVKRAS
ncbi:MAG: sigma-54 dependent transcriptional regulator [Pseudomonadota bacterium]